MKIKLKDGSEIEVQKGLTVLEVAKQISEGLARVATAGKVNGEVKDLRYNIEEEANVEILTFENDIVPGTINFKPKKVPATSSNNRIADQKQFFDDNRLNYIAYYSGIPTMDTEYTSQEAYTQLSQSVMTMP